MSAVVPHEVIQALRQVVDSVGRLFDEDRIAAQDLRSSYYTSAVSGEDWVQDLLNGDQQRIRNELGVHRSTFILLVKALQSLGLQSSRNVSIEEQLSIFLYTVVTGLSCVHVAERFQHPQTTITKYFERVLHVLATPPFYTTYVRPPGADSPAPPQIRDNPELYPFFDRALGVVDGIYFQCTPPSADDREVWRNPNGVLTQNCLAACSFDLRFTYFLSGWEGSVDYSELFSAALRTDFKIPSGRYYLADAGFASSKQLLVPYQNVCYHLSEWKEAPRNPKELFNLRHAKARSVIERIFGILMQRFRILELPPEYDISIQARIPAALASLHNFIRQYDPEEIHMFDHQEIDSNMGDSDMGFHPESAGELGVAVSPNESARTRRYRIATDMWERYQRYLESRAAGH